MAYSRLLLLLIGVISTRLPDVQARPTSLWCNNRARENMDGMIKQLKEDMVHCVGSDTLSSSVQLPCVWIQITDWKNKTPQQKRAEVVGALQMFKDGLQGARNQTTSPCQNQLLERLEHHVTNYLDIVKSLQIQNDPVTASHSAVQNCYSETSLDKVLTQYKMLLNGKLRHLAIDIQTACAM